MIRICYSIHHVGDRKFGEKPPFDDPTETHGLCSSCFPIEMEDLKREIEEHEKRWGKEDEKV